MKKLTLFFIATLILVLSGCDNPAKSKAALDEGLKLFYDKGAYSEAADWFNKAINYDKNNYEAYYFLGCTKFNRGMFDEAIIDFEKAIEIKPGYYDPEFALGRIYYMRQDFDMACYYYKAAEQHGRSNMEEYEKACP